MVPARFLEIMNSGTPEHIQRAMCALMPMNKLIVAEFEEVF